MKIAHVVTFTSADGAFGGPTRVALGQAKALAKRGHEVTVYAGAPAGEAKDIRQDGYRLRTFPVVRVAPFGGFAALWPRGLRSALAANARSTDVAHIHLARDLATLPAALTLGRLGVPYVTQSHGMIDDSDKRSAALLDRLATRRALSRSASWLLLTDAEGTDLARMATPRRTTPIRNGIEETPLSSLADRSHTVLFLARLHKRKRPLAFVQMAQMLSERLPRARFLIVGPDEGEGPAVARAIESAGLGDRLEWVGAIPPAETMSAMSDARVYVLPAVNEVFPMSILEAFAAGTPVVTTSSLGIADECQRFGAAIITDGTAQQLADATLAAYTDIDRATALRAGAREYLRSELDVDDVASTLEHEYIASLSAPR
ncbi:glycosyltransferase [Microbacterium sp. VKM Ac-2923]|uniref:glycosyltransferase n=1 Tax=Microbacterium sp. VKM Ac-2923 TaxID=2929476 RepID=UPI001FB1EE44|nr:glycosyltransferase [Microbacterium sp. VKM Ac-2923]MCJ1706807.1 glycosyltransferase [Microbacterium sp. VKM Ac-2923]